MGSALPGGGGSGLSMEGGMASSGPWPRGPDADERSGRQRNGLACGVKIRYPPLQTKSRRDPWYWSFAFFRSDDAVSGDPLDLSLD
jgi:hypothetical protein